MGQLPSRRSVLTAGLASCCSAFVYAQEASAGETPPNVFVERAAQGTPHKGKVLLAVQAHSDDIPLMARGVVAKLVREGYTGYLLRATPGSGRGNGSPSANNSAGPRPCHRAGAQ
jgi:hypothetical protein